MSEALRGDLMELMKQKDVIEKAIMDTTEYLENAPGGAGVKGKLVDDEGFPRADLDIMEIRKMRNRLACLQTDHVAVMKQIEQGLYRLHEEHYKKEEVKEGAPIESVIQRPEEKASTSEPLQSTIPELKIPFAWISDVIADSPAEAAGLKVGDAIYKFGNVDSTNHENLTAIVNLVKQELN